MFTCCHPALPRAAQVALTLRVVCGLTTAQVAKAFLVPETTVAQRITRAKRKIGDAGIPYRIPAPDELGRRLAEVLAVIYLLGNEGYLSTGGQQSQARDLIDDADIVVLYDMLLHLAPSPVNRLQRAIALRYVTGPAAALSEVDSLGPRLDDYHLFHATRAELLRDLGDTDQARDADEKALALTVNPAEQSLLRQRLNWA